MFKQISRIYFGIARENKVMITNTPNIISKLTVSELSLKKSSVVVDSGIPVRVISTIILAIVVAPSGLAPSSYTVSVYRHF